MCRCFFSDCPGVEIPEHPPLQCRNQVYVFIREPCENPSSVNCIPTWYPDPRGNHDQCSNCIRTQLYIFPAGVKTSPSKRRVHTPWHFAPDYAPPPYVRPPGYEDSRPSMVPESTAAPGLELPLTPTRFNLPVVTPMPTRRPPPSGSKGQTLRIPTANTATRRAEPPLAGSGFPTTAPETNSGRTGLRVPTADAAARPAGRRLATAGFPTPPLETNSRRIGLRIPTPNTATRLAEPGPPQSTTLGRTGLRAPTAYDTVRPPTPSPSRNLNPPATGFPTLATSSFPRPPTRRLLVRSGFTERLVSVAAAVETPTGQPSRLTFLPLPRALPVVYTGGTDTRTHPPITNPQQAPRSPNQGRSALPGSTESRAGTVEAPTRQQSWLTSPPLSRPLQPLQRPLPPLPRPLPPLQRPLPPLPRPLPPLPRVFPVPQAGDRDPRMDPSTANSQPPPENSPTPPPRSDTPRPAGMFLAPPPRHYTRSPPLGVNLAEWDVEEAAPQVNSNSNDWNLDEPTHVARGNRGNGLGLGNRGVVDQSNIAQTGQNSVIDAGSPMENQRSSGWRSVREWARRTGDITRRLDNEREHEQQRRSASRRGDSSRSSGQANQQDLTQRRRSLADSFRGLRRQLFTARRQNNQPESGSYQPPAGLGSSQNPVHIPLARNNHPTAAAAGGQSPSHDPIAAAAGGRPSTPMSDSTVSEVLRRTRHQAPNPSQQRSHARSDSGSSTTPSISNTGSEGSQDRGYDTGDDSSQSSGSNHLSIFDHDSIEELDGAEELLEIGSAIVRVDTGAQASDWDWNF